MKHLILPLTFSGIIACSHKTVDQAHHDPIIDIFKNWSVEIAELKTPGTPKSLWDSKTSEHYTKKISSLEELNSILSNYESLTQEDAERYRELFRNSSSTYGYAFELQLSALVFFDEHNRTKDAFLRS